MEIYLIRHGIAVEQGVFERDEERPLTEQGRAKTVQVAHYFLQKKVLFDGIFHSPLVRARQTAEILHEERLSDDPLSPTSELAPGGDLRAWLKKIAPSPYNETDARLALVGHEPDLSEWAEILLWGEARNRLILKKAGIIGLQVPDLTSAIANSDLFLLVSPKWLG